MNIRFRPLDDRILVKRTKKEEKTPGGLHIPDTRQVKSRFGEVLAVGPGHYLRGTNERKPVEVKPGQVVFFRGTSGQEVELEGEEGYVILREDEVEGIQE